MTSKHRDTTEHPDIEMYSDTYLTHVANEVLSRDLTEEFQKADTYEGPMPPAPEPGEPVMVGWSLRLPVETVTHLREVAVEHNTTPSALVRSWIDAELAGFEGDRIVSLADVMRVIRQVQPPRRAA